MTIEEIFSINPDLGAKTPEPNLWYIVYKYYLPHFPADQANRLADDYMEAIELESKK